MRDDYLTSDWAAEHRRASGFFHKLASAFLQGIERLNARQFDAPWRRPSPSACRPVR